MSDTKVNLEVNKNNDEIMINENKNIAVYLLPLRYLSELFLVSNLIHVLLQLRQTIVIIEEIIAYIVCKANLFKIEYS